MTATERYGWWDAQLMVVQALQSMSLDEEADRVPMETAFGDLISALEAQELRREGEAFTQDYRDGVREAMRLLQKVRSNPALRLAKTRTIAAETAKGLRKSLRKQARKKGHDWAETGLL